MSESDFRRSSSSTISIDLTEFESLTAADVMRKVYECAQDLARQNAHHFFTTIEETCQEVGNVIDCGGGSLTGERLLEMFERISMEFDRDGNPRFPTVVAHPKAQDTILRVFKQMEESPELADRMQSILDRKKAEWLARESARKLVG